MTPKHWAMICLIPAALWFTAGSEAQDSIVNTPHNLSAGGPGTVRAVSESQVCIFCHAPHHTSGTSPLWNRATSQANYQIYQSTTLDAQPDQPTGSSKLCLSCHDGTIALGSVLSRPDQIQMVGGNFMPAGLTNLGTDLSDDHPISFLYSSGLAAADSQLVAPSALPPQLRLDANSQLQCTTCHDAHHNPNGKFLLMDNRFSALCTSCHERDGWATCSHNLSGASVAGAPQGNWPYATVSENACMNCHRPHGAEGSERLLARAVEEDNCLICHDGQVASTNIKTELDKFTAHDPRLFSDIHDPTENLATIQDHVECFDCHNPHAVSPQTPPAGYIPIGATQAFMPGIDSGGTAVSEAQFQYEVCFRCHADSAVNIPGRTSRVVQTSNLRLKFNPSNQSFHPVITSSPNPDVVSLRPTIPSGSLLRCTDCHNNDSGPAAGGSGPQGPHGSIYDFLLERNYTMVDNTEESSFEYALCYKCHRESSILDDESFDEHDKHIRGSDVPCFACHDPHGVDVTQGGSGDHTNLINFNTQIVSPHPTAGGPTFVDLGRFRGSCTLLCHGESHNNRQYPR